ncbi:hypothetical protein AAVH_18066 [Aphelenchoides avenae]|nr:hypothetical protein AAVH_18066 [Aphelenchus avenae]
MPKGDTDWTKRGSGTYTSDECDSVGELPKSKSKKDQRGTPTTGMPPKPLLSDDFFADYLRNSYNGLYGVLCSSGRIDEALEMRQTMMSVLTDYQLKATMTGHSPSSKLQGSPEGFDLSQFFDGGTVPGGQLQKTHPTQLKDASTAYDKKFDTLRTDLNNLQKQVATQKDRLDVESSKRVAQEAHIKEFDVQLDGVQALLMQLTEMKAHEEGHKSAEKKGKEKNANVECGYCKEKGHQLPHCVKLQATVCPVCKDSGHTAKKCPKNKHEPSNFGKVLHCSIGE